MTLIPPRDCKGHQIQLNSSFYVWVIIIYISWEIAKLPVKWGVLQHTLLLGGFVCCNYFRNSLRVRLWTDVVRRIIGLFTAEPLWLGGLLCLFVLLAPGLVCTCTLNTITVSGAEESKILFTG